MKSIQVDEKYRDWLMNNRKAGSVSDLIGILIMHYQKTNKEEKAEL